MGRVILQVLLVCTHLFNACFFFLAHLYTHQDSERKSLTGQTYWSTSDVTEQDTWSKNVYVHCMHCLCESKVFFLGFFFKLFAGFHPLIDRDRSKRGETEKVYMRKMVMQPRFKPLSYQIMSSASVAHVALTPQLSLPVKGLFFQHLCSKRLVLLHHQFSKASVYGRTRVHDRITRHRQCNMASIKLFQH